MSSIPRPTTVLVTVTEVARATDVIKAVAQEATRVREAILPTEAGSSGVTPRMASNPDVWAVVREVAAFDVLGWVTSIGILVVLAVIAVRMRQVLRVLRSRP